jgi:hypothetical protein
MSEIASRSTCEWSSAGPIHFDEEQQGFGHRASRVGRVVLLSVLFTLAMFSMSSLKTSSESSLVDESVRLKNIAEETSKLAKSQIRLLAQTHKSKSGHDSNIRYGPLNLLQIHREIKIVPRSKSTKLWDMPEIKRYQVTSHDLC